VERVTWHEAADFCNHLSGIEGLSQCYTCQGSGPSVTCAMSDGYASPYDCPGYRLPTEAEWEYTARAGTSESTYNGNIAEANLDCTPLSPALNPIAWYCGNSDDQVHPVATRDPNPWDLFDMIGNVWEWCHDYPADYDGDETDPWGETSGSARVNRGGCWNGQARYARVGNRADGNPIERKWHRGFRPVRTTE